MLSADTFIKAIRNARAQDGLLTADEVQPALAALAQADDVTEEIKAQVVGDLLDTARSRVRRGGLHLGDGVGQALSEFVGARDTGRPGLWLDPPKRRNHGVSSLSRFVRSVRSAPSNRRSLEAALEQLARASDASDAVKSAIVENLLLAAHHGKIDIRDTSALRDFLDDHDPQTQGAGWLEP